MSGTDFVCGKFGIQEQHCKVLILLVAGMALKSNVHVASMAPLSNEATAVHTFETCIVALPCVGGSRCHTWLLQILLHLRARSAMGCIVLGVRFK